MLLGVLADVSAFSTEMLEDEKGRMVLRIEGGGLARGGVVGV